MNKHDWQPCSLLDAWKARRVSKKERTGYDQSVYICHIAVDFSTDEYVRFQQGIHAALTEDGLSTDGWGFDLASTHERDGHWRRPVMGTQDYTANDRRLLWLKEQVEAAHE